MNNNYIYHINIKSKILLIYEFNPASDAILDIYLLIQPNISSYLKTLKLQLAVPFSQLKTASSFCLAFFLPLKNFPTLFFYFFFYSAFSFQFFRCQKNEEFMIIQVSLFPLVNVVLPLSFNFLQLHQFFLKNSHPMGCQKRYFP